jgi:uncharacterized protein
MNDEIIEFIEKQKCASICSVDEQGKPRCFSCFYVFDKEGYLHFKSSAETIHMQMLVQNPFSAGTILPDKLHPLIVKGIQFEGVLLEHAPREAAIAYHKKYPYALAIPGRIWTLQLNRIKMTDSTKSFGKKIIWNREEVVLEL